MNKTSMQKCEILFLWLATFNVIAQTKHSLTNCQKCLCTKWHQTSVTDSATNEKIIVLLKQKGNGCSNNKNCKVVVADGYCAYKSITCQYYTNGKMHIKTTENGSYNGWSENSTATIEYFDTSGKLINKENSVTRGQP